MNTRKIIALALFSAGFVFQGPGAFAQDLKKEIESMKHAFDSDHIYSFAIDYSYYDDLNPKIKIDSLKGQMIIQQKNFSYTLNESTLIKNEKYMLKVNNSSKVIEVFDSEFQEPGILSVELIDSLFKYTGIKAHHSGETKTSKTYHFKYTKGELAYFELTFNKSTFFPEKLIYQYHSSVQLKQNLGHAPRIEIALEVQSKKYSKDIFSDKKFIKNKGASLELAAAYKNYELKKHLNNR